MASGGKDKTVSPRHPLKRRTVLQAAAALSFQGIRQAAAQSEDSAQAAPREGDRLVFAFGSQAGKSISAEDVPLGGPQVFAYPMDPATGVMRDGSRLNQVILVRLDPASLKDETRDRAVDGIVAYSAVCSHTGCEVDEWLPRTQTLHCKCHDSEFDPANAARVEFGPAPRRLAALPLKTEEGALVVAGSFVGRVGAAQR
jgi:Rieske Fe-S protein